MTSAAYYNEIDPFAAQWLQFISHEFEYSEHEKII